MSYTIACENRLLGTWNHRKATIYPDRESAITRAKEEASRSRSFAYFNVLDTKGNIVATFQGGK